MGISSDSADQIVKFALDGSEVIIKLTGALAKNTAVMLYAMLKDSRENSGKVQLKKLIRENRNITFIEVPRDQLKNFAREAKRYGVQYTAIREHTGTGPVELMVRADDAARVNRIAERLRLATVTMEKQEERSDPMKAKTARESANLSEPISTRYNSAERDKPSVKTKLKEISEKLHEQNAADKSKNPQLANIKIPERRDR